MITCAVVVAIRNEPVHLRRLIKSYAESGIDIVIIDNGSTDETAEICQMHLGQEIIHVYTLPWHQCFDLSSQLEAKACVISKLPHDWVIHADADEVLESPWPNISLLEGLDIASSEGYNCVNFDEFVFLPSRQQNELNNPFYYQEILHYYYFSPKPMRLMRAWCRSILADNQQSGGHQLSGERINVFPDNFLLRHYIVLSAAHANQKYSSRQYSNRDLSKGFHSNRIGLQNSSLELPHPEDLHKLNHWSDKNLNLSRPCVKHFWEWPFSQSAVP